MTAQLGDTVTLPCFYPAKDVKCVSWVKQPLGQPPQVVAMKLNYQSEAEFFNHFKNNKRLSAKTSTGTFNLTVLGAETLDSATYYCTFIIYKEILFGNGTTLLVMGEYVPSSCFFMSSFSTVCIYL